MIRLRIFPLILLLALVLAVASPDFALADPCTVTTWIDVAGVTSLDPAGVDLSPGTLLSVVAAITCTVETEVNLAFGFATFAGTTSGVEVRMRCDLGLNVTIFPPPPAPPFSGCGDALKNDQRGYSTTIQIWAARTRALAETVLLAANVSVPIGLPDVVFVGVVIAPETVTGDLIFRVLTNPSAAPDARSSVIRCFRQNLGGPYNCKTLP